MVTLTHTIWDTSEPFIAGTWVPDPRVDHTSMCPTNMWPGGLPTVSFLSSTSHLLSQTDRQTAPTVPAPPPHQSPQSISQPGVGSGQLPAPTLSGICHPDHSSWSIRSSAIKTQCLPWHHEDKHHRLLTKSKSLRKARMCRDLFSSCMGAIPTSPFQEARQPGSARPGH